jgi:hypothetical protein
MCAATAGFLAGSLHRPDRIRHSRGDRDLPLVVVMRESTHSSSWRTRIGRGTGGPVLYQRLGEARRRIAVSGELDRPTDWRENVASRTGWNELFIDFTAQQPRVAGKRGLTSALRI